MNQLTINLDKMHQILSENKDSQFDVLKDIKIIYEYIFYTKLIT